MIPDIGYERVTPELLQVDSLKINVRSDTINDDPALLTSQQSLIVGRQLYGSCNIYNLVVDHEGVMINAPLSQRTETKDQYALLVNGNVFVTGTVTSGESNFEGIQYDPKGYIPCVSDSFIALDSVVEVAGLDNNGVIRVRKCNTEYSTAVLGVCASITSAGNGSTIWNVEVQTAGIATVRIDGEINIGDMLTSGLDGKAIATRINGEIIDSAIHGYTIGKALQSSKDTDGNRIRCLFNVIKAPPLGADGIGFWELGSNESANIFYGGNVTIGRDYASRHNMYALNIVAAADRTINHAQLNIENTQASQLRMGIIGTSNVSPALINTCEGTSIEFHAGRAQQYFEKMYTACNWEVRRIVQSETPDYGRYNSTKDAPHMIIGTDGNVGIHTSYNPAITFQVRNQLPNGMFPTVTESMALHVQGNTYTSNLMIWDYDSGYPKNIDELYVRRLGKTFAANSIIPGTFAPGSYAFQCNLGVAGSWDSNFGLKVWDNSMFTKDVTVAGWSKLDNLECGTSVFKKDINAYNDIVVAGALRLEGGIFVSVLSNIDMDGTEHYTWQAIDFKPAGSNVTDLNRVGNGLTTPGRFGVGVTSRDSDARNGIRSQFVINKRNPTVTGNIWELELKDLSSSAFTPVGWIGHPLRQKANGVDDASLFFATPPKNDKDYSGIYDTIKTNMYFYPGKGSLLGVDVSIPPTFAVFSEGAVGVCTESPKSEMTVWGSITFTEKLMFFDKEIGQSFDIGLWKSGTFPVIGGTPPTFQGIQYNNASAPHVGINVQPQPNYGVVLGSNIKVVGSYFAGDDSRLAQWYDGNDSNTKFVSQSAKPSVSPSMFSWANVGIGIQTPLGDLDIKNNYKKPTSLRLICSDTTSTSAISMIGAKGSWKMVDDDNSRSLYIGYDSSNINNCNLTVEDRRPLSMTWNNVSGVPQTFIGCSPGVLLRKEASNLDKSASLFVDGGVSVIGDVRISGTYYASGQIMFNSNASTPSNLGVDDVYIGGGHVILNSSGDKSIIMGNPAVVNDLIDEGDPAMMRVYGSTTNSTIASFKTGRNDGLIEISSSSTGDILKFGVLHTGDTSRNGCPFAFLDKAGNPYMSFNKSEGSSTINRVGFNTYNPEAILHVTSTGTGSNMLKLTTTMNQEGSECSEIELEKVYTGDTDALPRSWTITGPNSEYRNKLSLRYKDGAAQPKEVFCFTSNGCMGIGTDKPQFALDVVNTGSVGGLRLANTGSSPMAQILMQSGNSQFGTDNMIDHRIYSYSNSFYIDAAKTDQVIPILHVDQNGHVGVRSNASSTYEMNVVGQLNVTDAILLNGRTLYSTLESVQDQSYLAGINVYLCPRPASGGGVHVNTSLELITGNLFYIASGENANMMVYDSTFEEAQVHFRTTSLSDTYNTWRMGTENDKFYWELWHDSDNNKQIEDTHTQYIRALDLAPSLKGAGQFDATVNGHLVLNVPEASISLGSGTGSVISRNANSDTTIKGSCVTLNGNGSSVTSGGNIVNVVNATSGVVTTINQQGSIGIGTSSARSALDIANGQVFVNNGSCNLPSYSFASSTNTGMFMLYEGVVPSMRIAVNGTTSATFTSGATAVTNFTCSGPLRVVNGTRSNITATTNGNVGIGTGTPLYQLHVDGTTGLNGRLLPVTTESWDVGCNLQRWRSAFFSRSIDINGTTISNILPSRNLFVSDGIETPRVAISGVMISSNAASPSSFSYTLPNSTVLYPVVTDTAYQASFASLRLSTSNVDPLQIFTSNADNIALLGSRTQANALVVKGSGFVGIGTGNPLSPVSIFTSNTSTVNAAIGVTQRGTGAIASFSNTNFGGGIYFTSNAWVGIGTSSVENTLQVKGHGFMDGNFICTSNMYVGQNLVVAGNTFTRYDQIVDSDKRLKSNLRNIENALEKVCTLTGYTYNYMNDTKRSTGLIAQDVLKVIPEAVGSNLDTGMLGVEYGSLMGLIVEAIKEIKNDLQELKSKLA